MPQLKAGTGRVQAGSSPQACLGMQKGAGGLPAKVSAVGGGHTSLPTDQPEASETRTKDKAG